MNKLTPIKKLDVCYDSRIVWLFKCECGNEKALPLSRVKKNVIRSCGCLKKENGKTHGYKYSITYSSWSSARDRTLNPKSKDFYRYGGKGIGFSDHWNKFENFLADMGERTSKDFSLDRIDGNKGYEPGNCRWATAKEQARNRKDFVILNVGGKKIPLVDYATQIGITKGSAHQRFKRKQLKGVCYE